MVALAFGCGLQQMEIIGLRRRHWRPAGEDVVNIDLAGETIDGSLIKSRHRILPIAPYLRMMVETYLRAWPGYGPDEPLFRDNDGSPATVTSVMTQIRNPGRRCGSSLTLPAFSAAFAKSLFPAVVDPGLYEYLIGTAPPEGSRWTDAHPSLATLRTLFGSCLEIWKIDRSFWHEAAVRVHRNQNDEAVR